MDKRQMAARLGEAYQYHQRVGLAAIDTLKQQPGGEPFWCTVATLIAGCVRLDAVFSKDGDLWRMGYDVLVRETLASSEWICYDSLSDADSVEEDQMLAVLERVMKESHLSYDASAFSPLDLQKVKSAHKEQKGGEK